MYIYTEYYSVIKKNDCYCHLQQHGWNYRTLYSMKSDREIQVSYHLYVEFKNKANESIYKTETESQTQTTNLWLLKGQERKGGTNWEYGSNRD